MQERLDDRVHQLLNKIVAFAALLAPDGRVKDVSQSALDVAGIDQADVTGRPFWQGYWFSHDAELQDRVRQAIDRARQGETVRFDFIARVRDDNRLIVEFQLAPILGPDGDVQELIASGVDVSEREANRQRAETALREASHRMKNLFATVRSVANLTKRLSPGDRALDDFIGRLDTLAGVHRLFSSFDGPERAEFEVVARRVLEPYADDTESRVTVRGDCSSIPRDQAKLLGLCLHEMATNSVKHGALSPCGAGRLETSLVTDRDGLTTFSWIESFETAPTTSEPGGYGLNFIKTTLAGLVGGPVHAARTRGGFEILASGRADDLFRRDGAQLRREGTDLRG